MARRSDVVDWVVEQLRPLGPVRARAMFSGFGLYRGDLFFALVIDEVLYLKADALSAADFIAAGSVAFSYKRKGGKIFSMSYYTLPDAAMDDADAMLMWCRTALAAAARAAKTKRR